ncbi:hypothetical protein EDB87DRAFT_1692799 [Lactarius vividus]|nr:hypothetical protein EDB87DRAFT_1692799 [Lactarius vividus]
MPEEMTSFYSLYYTAAIEATIYADLWIQVQNGVSDDNAPRPNLHEILHPPCFEPHLPPPTHEKGAVIWEEIHNQEGYFIFDVKNQEYHQVHYLDDLRLWAYIDYDPKHGRWYAYKPVPPQFGAGPLGSTNITGINIDPDESTTLTPIQPAMATNTQVATSLTTVGASSSGGGGAHATGGRSAAQTGGTTHSSSTQPTTGSSGGPTAGPSGGIHGSGGGPPGGGAPGGGGGGPGGGAPGGGAPGGGALPVGPAGAIPAPGGGKLGGNPPPIFDGNREESRNFLRSF